MPYLTREPIDVNAWRWSPTGPRDGASVEFLGTVRAVEADRPIEALEYEAYEPMAEAMIGRLIDEAKHLWPLHRVEVRHRVGRIPVGEVAVLVGVWAAHREEAFSACRFLIGRIKEEAPIWKKAFQEVVE